MLKESAAKKVMLCIFNSDTVTTGCVGDMLKKNPNYLEKTHK